MAAHIDALLDAAVAARNDALAHATGGGEKAGPMVAMATLDTLLAQAYIMRTSAARSHRALSRLESFLERALPRVVGAESVPTGDVYDFTPSEVDQLVEAVSQAMACMDATHPARVRLAAAMRTPGLGFMVAG